MKKKMFLFICAALMIVVCAVSFAAEPESGGATVVAKVENEVITQEEIDKLLANLDPQMAMMYSSPEGRASLVDELVNARLFMLKGMEEGLDKSPEYLAEIETFKKHALSRVAVTKSLENVAVTDEDAKKFYDENPSQFTQPEQVSASHILVSDDAAMQVVLADLKAGKTFEETAVKYSICPSKERSGDLGTFGKGQMVKEFEDAAFSAEIGKVTDPVKTQFGVHVIRVNGKTPESVVPFAEVAEEIKPYILEQKRREAYQTELNALKAKYKIELTAPVPTTAPTTVPAPTTAAE